MSGKSIVHKCCDLNEAYSVNHFSCISSEGYSTRFVDQLRQNQKYFFRIGPLTCPDQNQIEDFRITTSGQLQIPSNEGEILLIHPDDYCLDDFVIFLDDELPEVITLVNYCPDSNKSIAVNIEPKVADKVEKPVSIRVPKCCPKGQIIGEDGCQNFKLVSGNAKLESIILGAFLSHFWLPNETLDLVADEYSFAYENAKIIKLDNESSADRNWITPIFESDEEGNVSMLLHYFVEKMWDYKASVNPFCVEMKIYKESYDVFYRPVVLFWSSTFNVPDYLVYLHFISVFALLVTICIYCFVPASSKISFLFFFKRIGYYF